MHTISNASQINLSVFFERFDETWLGWRQGNAYLHIWSSNVRCCRLYFRQSLSTSWDPAIQWPDKTFLRERVTWPQTTRLNQLLFSTRGETVDGDEALVMFCLSGVVHREQHYFFCFPPWKRSSRCKKKKQIPVVRPFTTVHALLSRLVGRAFQELHDDYHKDGEGQLNTKGHTPLAITLCGALQKKKEQNKWV